jgi:hypothetical protein
MRRARILIVALGLGSLLGVVGIAYGAEAFDGAKPATAAFHDLDKAKAAGYTFRLPDVTGATCIAQPGLGGMGVHMVDTSLLDGTIDAEAPEALVYEEKKDGELKLAALEYVVFQADWKGSKPPALFGREFDFVPAPNRFDLPAFYALHAWIWKPNPSGILSAWNPRVTCG